MADILADFDPIRSKEILDKCTYTEIADIWLSRQVFHDIDDGD